VVVRWSPGEPVRVLALRDELQGREFDDPGAWWPEQPDVVGGRDRVAGGSWAVTDVREGVTALVLNRPERRVAEPGAASRGVVPLLAVEHGADWPLHLDVSGMASFNLVLAGPEALTLWVFDGRQLTSRDLGEGTRMVTSGGAEDGKAERYLPAFESTDDWIDVVRGVQPADDPASLVVRHVDGERVFATVFGQLITAAPGAYDLSFSRTPWTAEAWTRG
jgi:uncharacterized protein with NRDE domain